MADISRHHERLTSGLEVGRVEGRIRRLRPLAGAELLKRAQKLEAPPGPAHECVDDEFVVEHWRCRKKKKHPFNLVSLT